MVFSSGSPVIPPLHHRAFTIPTYWFLARKTYVTHQQIFPQKADVVKKHLNICVKIEETVGSIYRIMLKSPHLTTAVRETLNELANDEDDHASQLRFALRFPEESVVNSLPEMLAEAQNLLQQAQSIQQKVEQIEVNDQQAISIGVELEKKFCQAHIGNSFEFKKGQLKDMFAAMAKEDERHCQRLLELQKSICQP